MLLPHERDETVGPESTAAATMHKKSRDAVEQAGRDVESGLKDTERRGIPSDIPAGIRRKRI